eukprot:TRINITY_DN12461_c0_g1_i1.p1 TRINITY_DN12461_c0_g1~~TRINITY_DN12461_c0_g1_i1.p1  ORF type:complete len:627 (-),score=120.01 TRINITY_DN12461_c0_g1_i1:1146-3026(-)
MSRPKVRSPRLLEAFLIVGIDLQDDPKNPFVPVIKSKFPEVSQDVDIPRDLPYFCFPEIELDQIMKHRVACYSFVLTDADGGQQFGFCRRIMPPSVSSAKPICLCLLTRFPYFSLYSTMLSMSEQLYMKHLLPYYAIPSPMPRPVCNFFASILRYPFPLPGESFMITTPEMIDYRLVRPDDDDSPLADVTFHHLFSSLHLHQILSLLAAVLAERRIVLVSSSLSKLSACCHATAAMIYPFNWQHIFIPVLPKKLLDYCTAPMPFLIGLQASCMPIFQRMPVEEVFLLNLDLPIPEDSELQPGNLPLGPLSTLRQALMRILARWNRVGQLDDGPVSASFLQFFVAIFGSYRNYIREDGPKIILNRDSFIENAPIAFRPFLEEFRHCQMFERFAAEREAIILSQREGHHVTGSFERIISHGGAGISSSSSWKSDVSGKLSSLKDKMKAMSQTKTSQTTHETKEAPPSKPADDASERRASTTTVTGKQKSMAKIMSYMADFQTAKSSKSNQAPKSDERRQSETVGQMKSSASAPEGIAFLEIEEDIPSKPASSAAGAPATSLLDLQFEDAEQKQPIALSSASATNTTTAAPISMDKDDPFGIFGFTPSNPAPVRPTIKSPSVDDLLLDI